MLQKTLKQGVGKWCPSTTGPLLPTMTDSLLAPGSSGVDDSDSDDARECDVVWAK